MVEETQIPDAVGPSWGWRLFRITDGSLVRSPQQAVAWPTRDKGDGWLDAECANQYTHSWRVRTTSMGTIEAYEEVIERRHDLVPDEHCYCGIYVLPTAGQATDLGLGATGKHHWHSVVLGTVEFKGRYVEYDSGGFRVERARLRSLCFRPGLPIPAVADRYGVPINDGPTAHEFDQRASRDRRGRMHTNLAVKWRKRMQDRHGSFKDQPGYRWDDQRGQYVYEVNPDVTWHFGWQVPTAAVVSAPSGVAEAATDTPIAESLDWTDLTVTNSWSMKLHTADPTTDDATYVKSPDVFAKSWSADFDLDPWPGTDPED